MNNVKELYLVLKKKWFLEILKGTKKEEYRDYTDYYIERLCEFDKDSNLIDVKKYDVIRFQLGYSKNAPQMIVELKEIMIEEDESDDEIFTPENCNFVLVLGEILEKINCESLNI